MSLGPIGLLIAGLLGLLVGAEIMVRGSSRLAASFGIPPLVVGLTIVAFGTSAPELAIALRSITTGAADIGIGNIIGSNISNIFLILGISAIIFPLAIAQRVVRLDVPIMIGLSVLVALLGWNGVLGLWEGVLLATLGAIYLLVTIRLSRTESAKVREEYRSEYGVKPGPRRRWLIHALAVVLGLGLLVFSANWLVIGAVSIARSLGLSELIIGLTVVAIGTSAPELVTSIVASLRGERDIAVGNIIGSNIMNIVVVLAVSAMVAPGGLVISVSARLFDVPVMIAAAIACLPVFYTGQTIARWEGVLFLAYYLSYISYLILNSTGHAALSGFGVVMLGYIIPITLVTLAVLVVRSRREDRLREG